MYLFSIFLGFVLVLAVTAWSFNGMDFYEKHSNITKTHKKVILYIASGPFVWLSIPFFFVVESFKNYLKKD
jgi:hypothetical protein